MSDQDLFVEELVQKPNRIIRTGGPQLLKGLMIPLCPSANRYWRSMPSVKAGSKFPMMISSYKSLVTLIRAITFPSDDAKAYLELMREFALTNKMRFLNDKPLRIDIVVCPRDRREIDAHNYHKVILDVFEKIGVYLDDDQIKDCRIRLGPIVKGGRMVISLWEIPEYSPDAVFKEAWG